MYDGLEEERLDFRHRSGGCPVADPRNLKGGLFYQCSHTHF